MNQASASPQGANSQLASALIAVDADGTALRLHRADDAKALEGRGWADPTLPGLSAEQRSLAYAEAGRVLAALHAADPASVGLSGLHANASVAAQIVHWTEQYRAAETHRIEAMENLIEWLPSHMPPAQGLHLVHGNFGVDQLVFHPTELRAVAVRCDGAALGDPWLDLAQQGLAWHLSVGPQRTLVGADLTALGIPTEAQYRGGYCEHAGRFEGLRAPVWAFYLALALFRQAAVQQVAGQATLDAAAGSSAADTVANRVQLTAEAGWEQALLATRLATRPNERRATPRV